MTEMIPFTRTRREYKVIGIRGSEVNSWLRKLAQTNIRVVTCLGSSVDMMALGGMHYHFLLEETVEEPMQLEFDTWYYDSSHSASRGAGGIKQIFQELYDKGWRIVHALKGDVCVICRPRTQETPPETPHE